MQIALVRIALVRIALVQIALVQIALVQIALVRICNPHALNISICNAIIGLKILILHTVPYSDGQKYKCIL